MERKEVNRKVNTHKRTKILTLKQKKLLFELKKNHDVYMVTDELNIQIDKVLFWRKTNFQFDKEYLLALGLTRRQERFLQVLPSKMLNISSTCKALNIHRSTYYAWTDKSDSFRLFFHEVYEGFLDEVEAILFYKLFVEKDIRALDIYAAAKMRDRGYGK